MYALLPKDSVSKDRKIVREMIRLALRLPTRVRSLGMTRRPKMVKREATI
jgi:hypothetical protein